MNPEVAQLILYRLRDDVMIMGRKTIILDDRLSERLGSDDRIYINVSKITGKKKVIENNLPFRFHTKESRIL
jgi:hypothetical protein